jgi:hypothetical protein
MKKKMKRINKNETQYGELCFEFNVTYEEETNLEEGHGIHYFYDAEEVNRVVTSVVIFLDNGEKIDITHKLNKKELKLISDSYV